MKLGRGVAGFCCLREDRGRCLLCSLDRFTVDTHPAGVSFESHTNFNNGAHSLWNYLYFIHYVTEYKDPDEFTGIESHVVKVFRVATPPSAQLETRPQHERKLPLNHH